MHILDVFIHFNMSTLYSRFQIKPVCPPGFSTCSANCDSGNLASASLRCRGCSLPALAPGWVAFALALGLRC